MKLPVLLAAAALAVTAAPSAQAAQSTEQVVRAWSAALNANHNEAAARLFAPNAEIVQGTLDARLTTHASAVAFNRSLPCAGRIIALKVAGRQARATFRLGTRPKHRCDGPGQLAAALIVVRAGKIVLWAQIPVPKSTPTA